MPKEKKYTLTDKQCEVFFKVIDLIEEGNSVRKIFENNPDIGVCRATFKKWIRLNDDCVAHYARATSERADILFDEMIELADKQDKDVQIIDGKEQVNHNIIHRNRLQIDTRKWILSKMNPKKYGEKLDITSKDEKLNDNKQINLTIGGKDIDLGYKDDENKSTS